jgi:hypothetical protein
MPETAETSKRLDIGFQYALHPIPNVRTGPRPDELDAVISPLASLMSERSETSSFGSTCLRRVTPLNISHSVTAGAPAEIQL